MKYSPLRAELYIQVNYSLCITYDSATCPHGYRTTLVAQGAKVPGTFVPPTVDTELDVSYVYKNTNHVIRVSTVDLNQEWQMIEHRLKEIIKEQ